MRFFVSGTTPVPASFQANCCNWLEHKAYAVQEKICGLCTTESKVHALLVTGRVLQAAALVSFPSAIAFSFVAAPIALVGLVPAVALGVLGTWIADNPKDLNERIQMGRPFVVGQPVGLTNGLNNCWLNSSLQLMANVPGFERRMRQIPEFAQFLDSYRAAGAGYQKVATEIQTQQIREVLQRESGGLIQSDPPQQDVADFFQWCFQGQNGLYQFDTMLDGAAGAQRSEPMIGLELDRSAPIPNFAQLFSNFFDYHTDRGQRRQVFFPATPDHLLIHVKRFYYENGAQGKINDPIEIEGRFQLPGHLVRSGENAAYSCDAVLVHQGGSGEAGHYVAYIKRDNVWWYCSDARVLEVSAAEAEAAMKQSYILHFAKV
jgi:hypothetical protein